LCHAGVLIEVEDRAPIDRAIPQRARAFSPCNGRLLCGSRRQTGSVVSIAGARTTMPSMRIDRLTRQNRNTPMEHTVPA
jgi:hypothetical protein